MKPMPELQLLSRTRDRPPLLAASIGSRVLEACGPASLRLGGPTLKSLGVTSTIRGEGRSTVALAMALIQQRDYGRKVLLLELDSDSPTLAERLGAEVWPGLPELLRGEATLKDVVHPLADGISVATVGAAAGTGPRTMIELLTSGVLSELAGECDVLVGDLPALLESNFGPLLADAFTQVLLVVRAGLTPLGRIQQAAAALRSEPAVLLNGTSPTLPPWIRKITRG